MPKMWKLAAPAPESLLFDLLDVPPYIVQSLFNRGLRTAAEMRAFLSPKDSSPEGDPALLADMDVAVARVARAVADRERICVYADFDVDGVCSAVLLTHVLVRMGARPDVYIPNRQHEGYGLNQPALSYLAAAGVDLLITADCGTSAVHDVAHANSLGMDVIVSDHHHVHGPLPPAFAVINPQRAGSLYPFSELAGVGVVYKLAQALEAAGHDVAAHDCIDLVAVGTVVDVARLLGENRTLVRQGLSALSQSLRPGLRALRDVARLQRPLDAGALGFVIGPRLNAAGRMDSARTSYDLLMCATYEEATPLAQKLDEQNGERQRLLNESLVEARLLASAQPGDGLLAFVASANFKPGIVGLIAGRLVEEMHRPAVVVELGDEESRGSCRSITGFHIAAALSECADLLQRHGGHGQAAGFTVRSDRLDSLRERLSEIARREFGQTPPIASIEVDSLAPLSQVNADMLGWLRRMAPFGAGNPAPVFQSNGVLLRRPRLLRNGHLGLHVSDGRVTWDAVAFRQGSLLASLHDGMRADIAYTLEESVWLGEPRLQLIIKDIRPS